MRPRTARVFADRADAGGRLARRLESFRDTGAVVVGLPRGGVPVAARVAEALGLVLDVILVRKLGVPWQPELGMGAVGEDGVTVVNDEIVSRAGVPAARLEAEIARERSEVAGRSERYRGGRPRVPLTGRTVLVVDDGIATGSTARAACQVARKEGAARVVLAVPVAPAEWRDRLAGEADELVCLETPEPFYAVGQFYDDFRPTTDDEVVRLLARAAGRGTADPGRAPEDGPRP